MYIHNHGGACIYTGNFFGGKTDENNLLRLYFKKISFSNLQKAVNHLFYNTYSKQPPQMSSSKTTSRIGGKLFNLHP
jgi:hypothetical protein